MTTASNKDGRNLLIGAVHAAVDAAMPANTLRHHIPVKPMGRTVVVGAGKGAVEMAAALEACWDGPLEGAVVVPYGQGRSGGRFEVLEASHPVPDAAGLAASHRLMHLVGNLTADDLVIALISGGAQRCCPCHRPA